MYIIKNGMTTSRVLITIPYSTYFALVTDFTTPSATIMDSSITSLTLVD